MASCRSLCTGLGDGATMEFLGLKFEPLDVSLRPVLEPFLTTHPHPLTGFSFAVLAVWVPVYRYTWTFLDKDLLLISCEVDSTGNRHLLQPIGNFGKTHEEWLLGALDKLDYRLRFFGLSRAFVDSHQEFLSQFTLRGDRDGANYIYDVQELATLAGKKFQKKRNLISQAQREYSWKVEPLTPERIPECQRVMLEIEREGSIETPSAHNEARAVAEALRLFGRLALEGLLISVAGAPVAFAVWEQQYPGTAVVHIEKALRSYKGLYQVVNQEVAKALLERGYQFVNREEDGGNEGLRQAKLTYNPIEIREAFFSCCDRWHAEPCVREW